MLTKRIIPCLDVDQGRVVKGTKFVNIRDAGDPVEVAARYNEMGADELCFLDIRATHEGRGIMHEVVEKTAMRAFMPLTVGGGLRTIDDIRAMLNAGADKVSLNSSAVKDPEFVKVASDRFGSQCIVVAIDAKQVATNKWNVFVNGGRIDTGLDVVEWAKTVVIEKSAGEILLTSMDSDGTKDGYDLALIRAVSEAVQVPIIASGGAGKLEHLRDALTIGKADAALAASIFHFQEYTIAECKAYLRDEGVAVRI